jgi:hypothetical protein
MKIINFMDKYNKKVSKEYDEYISEKMEQTLRLTSWKLILLNENKYNINKIKMIDTEIICKCLDKANDYIMQKYNVDEINKLDNLYDLISNKAIEFLIKRCNLCK